MCGNESYLVNHPIVTIILTWYVLLISYKPHPLVGVVIDSLARTLALVARFPPSAVTAI